MKREVGKSEIGEQRWIWGKQLLRALKKNLGVFIGLTVMIVASSIISDVFLTKDNILNVLRNASALGVISVGATFVILLGGIDLSVGSVLTLSCCLVAGITSGRTENTFIAIIIALLSCITIGFVNGIIITKRRVEPFIATLGMMTIVQGIVMIYTHGAPTGQVSKGFRVLGNGYLGPIPVPVIIFLFFIVMGMVILYRTIFGRYIFAIGGNAEVSRLSGISVDFYKIIVYCISSLTAALAGFIVAGRVGVGDFQIGRGFELNAIAAVVIGGTSMAGGKGGLGGTIAGVLIISIMNNMINLTNLSPYIQQAVMGSIIIIAVVFQRGWRNDVSR